MLSEAVGYRILIGGRPVSRGALRMDKLLAIDFGGSRYPVDGEETRDPAYNAPARWVEPCARCEAV